MELKDPSQNAVRRSKAGFTLMEVVVSIGLLAVALSAIAGSIGYSSRRGAETSRESQAVWMLEGMLSESREAVRGRQQTTAIHRFGIPRELPGSVELWFDGQGGQVEGREDAFYRCRLEFQPDPAGTRLMHLHGRVTWPAAAMEGREQGSAELFTSLLMP